MIFLPFLALAGATAAAEFGVFGQNLKPSSVIGGATGVKPTANSTGDILGGIASFIMTNPLISALIAGLILLILVM